MVRNGFPAIWRLAAVTGGLAYVIGERVVRGAWYLLDPAWESGYGKRVDCHDSGASFVGHWWCWDKGRDYICDTW